MIERTEFESGTFYLGDCFEVMAGLEAGSVDMVLADLPYGTTQNKWDSVLPLNELWKAFWNVCRGSILLTAAQPFTSALIMSQPNKFKYEWIWHKSRPSGHMNAKKQPMRAHESIVCFYDKQPVYNPQMTIGKKNHVNTKPKIKSNSTNYGAQYEVVEALTDAKYPTTIIPFTVLSPTHIIHPTQKPVALFEYLIRTYTNEGQTVLDNTAGSGTTAIAAMNAERRWICIEKDETYYRAAVERVRKHEEKMKEAA